MQPINRIEQAYRRLRGSGKQIQRLFSGNPNEHGFRFPPEILERAYSGYFQRQDYQPDPKGLRVARQAVADFYSRQGLEIDAEHTLITSGSSESFHFLFQLLKKTGGNFLVPRPGYPLFDSIAELAGVELRHYELNEAERWRVDLPSLRHQTDPETRGIVLVSPHNPTGAVLAADQIREITEWANERELPLLCDEVFSEFFFGPGEFPRVVSHASPRLAFTLNGLSKMFALPGLKLSWIAVTGETALVEPAVDALETLNDTFLSCHYAIQEALPAIFREGGFLRGYAEEVRARRDLAMEVLSRSPDISMHTPQGGFYLMGRVLKDLPDSEEDLVIRLMEEEGIFVHPGYFYDAEEGTHFVVSFLTEPQVLRSGLERLVGFIQRR